MAEDTVTHWRDFVCPFCYVGQSRTALLRDEGYRVDELPFAIHPEIPPEGIAVGPRTGAMYEFLEREAARAGLPLRWPPRLPDTSFALAAAEAVRRDQPEAFAEFDRLLFSAHFAEGADIGDPDVVLSRCATAGADPELVVAAIEDGSASAAVDEARAAALRAGVSGTPAWLVDGRLILGLRPISEFP